MRNIMNQFYDKISLHDNLVHGISFSSDVGDFSSIVSFDIDHIMEWVNCSPEEGESIFKVAPAKLKFYDTTDLILNISWGDSKYSKYSGSSAGFYILDVIREKVDSPLKKADYYKWEILTNHDDYIITFGASYMSLDITGAPRLVNRQYLYNNER